MSTTNLRVAVMWTELSGYLNACLNALFNRYNVELDVTRIANEGTNRHPYDESIFEWMPSLRTLPDAGARNAEKLLTEIKNFAPHVAIISGWDMPVYRKVARTLRKQGVYVIGAVDNPWHGSLKQRIGVFVSPWYVTPLFDVLWVPGERGATFARYLGFSGEHIMQGLYSADCARFSVIGEWREKQDQASWPRRFLFAGRFSREKGIEDLVSAYQLYKEVTERPWDLWVAGNGPLDGLLSNIDGVRLLGFIQPEYFDQILRQVGVFVLPSHYDPWPLVIHEMTLAGLPILCSRQCGSSVELVQDGYNGFLFDAGDVDGLASLLQLVSSKDIDLLEMGRRSTILSNRYSPEQWADYLIDHISRYVQTK